MITRIARPYAKALLDSVRDDGEAKRVRDDLTRFRQATVAVPRILEMAANPAIPLEVKQHAVGEIARSLRLGEMATRFLALLTDHYRLTQLTSVLEAVDELLNRRLGVVIARITTAQPLDDEQRRRLVAVLKERLHAEVEVALEVNPKLLGGFVVQVGSVRYDGSLSGQLDRMATQLGQAQAA